MKGKYPGRTGAINAAYRIACAEYERGKRVRCIGKAWAWAWHHWSCELLFTEKMGVNPIHHRAKRDNQLCATHDNSAKGNDLPSKVPKGFGKRQVESWSRCVAVVGLRWHRSHCGEVLDFFGTLCEGRKHHARTFWRAREIALGHNCCLLLILSTSGPRDAAAKA